MVSVIISTLSSRRTNGGHEDSIISPYPIDKAIYREYLDFTMTATGEQILMDTKSEVESEFDRFNERAILKIVHDVLLDFAAFLSLRPGEIMQEVRSRLPKPLAVTDDRTPEELKRDGDDPSQTD